MKFELTSTADVWRLLVLCALFGSVGAIAYDLTEPIRGRFRQATSSAFVLRTARSRLVDLLGKAKLDGRVEGATQMKRAVKKAVAQHGKEAPARAKTAQAAADPTKAGQLMTQHSDEIAGIVEQVAEEEVIKLANSSPWGNPPPP
jgi:hypothetical protein